VEIRRDILKSWHRCRPSGTYDKTSITIHSTGNPASSAQNERDWLDNPSNRREASWHYVVDEKGVIQAIPDEEEAWHCGNTIGNRFSIGLEICEGGDREKTLRNAVNFAVQKMKEYGFTLTDIVRHYDWTGKNCPRILIDKKYIKDGMDWEWFMKEIESRLRKEKEMEKVYNWTLEVPEWGRPTVQKLLDKGYLQGNEKGELELTYAMLKLLVINDRAGLYD
jgi:N-acetylmuramoyl-L-alanine amidase